MKKKLLLMLLMLATCTVLMSVYAYAEDNYPWVIGLPGGKLNDEVIYAGGDEYRIRTSIAMRDTTVPCDFKALAFYNSDDELIAISTDWNLYEGVTTFKITSSQEPAYYKVFAWDDAKSMMPVAESKTYPVESGLYYLLPEGDDLETAQTVKIKLIGATPVEAKVLRPAHTCYFWKEDADLLDWYSDQEFTDIENNEFTFTQNGQYLVYVKDQDGKQYFQWVGCYNIQAPKPKLYYESAYHTGDWITARLYVGLEKQNSNAEITQMGILNYRPEPTVGDYPNSNVHETKYLEKATPVKEGDVITITGPCAYTLVVKDSWGNTGLYGIEIKDIYHERVVDDLWDKRYHITEK